MKWSTACPDWDKRLLKGEPLIACPVLFPDYADYAMDAFCDLKIVDILGTPTIGEVTRDWALDMARVFFGSLDPEKNHRHIQEFFLLISKKNTKSTLAAGLMLTVLCLNPRKSAEFLILAPTVEAANNAFNPARDMVKNDDDLKDLCHVQEHIRTITYRNTGAKLKVVAADSDTVSGSKASGVLVDELWAFGRKNKARSMFTEATGGLMSRSEGFVMYLTTQSDDPPAGVFKEKLNYARNVRDGKIEDPNFLPILYEFPERLLKSGDYKKPEYWHITNPNLGASVNKDFLKRKLATAEEGGEESIQEVLAKHLNVEIGVSLQSNRWRGADFWLSTAMPEITIDYILDNCEVIDVGIDGGGLDDLLGLCVMGRHSETQAWLSWQHAWAHPSVLELRKEIAPRLKDFEKEGTLTVVQEIGDDIDQLVDIVDQIEKADLLDKIGVDPVGIGDVLDALDAKEIDEKKIIGISQGWKLGGAIKTAERRLADNTLLHPGSELMNWCVGNARIEPRANSILITKQASGTAKIDPLMATLNAVSLMALNPKPMTRKFELFIM